MYTAGTVLEWKMGLRQATVGASGALKLLELQTNGIIPTRMRHLIKRFLKKAGFMSLKVEHRAGPNPFTVTLLATGTAPAPVSEEQVSKLRYLTESVVDALNQSRSGYPIHASQADPEFLRRRLAEVEPNLSKTYYAT